MLSAAHKQVDERYVRYIMVQEIDNDNLQRAREIFPLYFWWNLTAILPLRVMEFLLIPRNCLSSGDNGESILTIRRTKLKGGFKRFAYRIKEDYELHKYVINEKLSEELQLYLKATRKMQQTEIGTLYVREAHYDYLETSVNMNSNYYSYANLNTCLQYFYNEIIDRAVDRTTNVNRITLGDTRHIAMANLIMSSGSPVICRELAGHSDINISSHYFTNISNLVECVTISRYRKSRGAETEMTGVARYAIVPSESRFRITEGWCDAPGIMNGDINECLKVSDAHGQIGNCVHCIHYWPDDQGIRLKFLDEQISKQAVDADCRYLVRMIEAVRKGIGYSEDIGAALLRLQRSCDHYSKSLWEKYTKGGEAHGKT